MKIQIKVIPQARRNQIRRGEEIWKVYLAAPAVEGKANKALTAFLAQEMKLRKSDIEITKGLKSPYKTITIKGEF